MQFNKARGHTAAIFTAKDIQRPNYTSTYKTNADSHDRCSTHHTRIASRERLTGALKIWGEEGSKTHHACNF